MASPPNNQRVRPYKRESALTGGDPAQARAWPVVATPQEDALDVRGTFFQEPGSDDADVATWREGGRLYLLDREGGPYSLAELASAGGGALASDADHGDRGGGSLHALAVAGGAAGFLSGLDKSRLNSLWTAHGANSYVLWTHNGAGGSAHALAVAGGAAGFLSGTDKSRLDSLWAGTAGLYAPATHDHGTIYAPAGHVGAGAGAHALASTTEAGFMSATDKDRLTQLYSGTAGVYSLFAPANQLTPRLLYAQSNLTALAKMTDTALGYSRGRCSLTNAKGYRIHAAMSSRYGNVYLFARLISSGCGSFA